MTNEQVQTVKIKEDSDSSTVTSDLPNEKQILQEQLRREVDYARAQRLLKSLLENGLISLSEFNKITQRNRKSFSPWLADIMPKSVDKP